MKKSEQKQKIVEELVRYFKALNVKQLYEKPDHKTSKDWLAEVAAVFKSLDESDYQVFVNHRQHLYSSIAFKIRKHAAEQIDGFVRQKVAEYKKYDFSYLDREIGEHPEDIANYIHDKELRDRCLDLLKAGSKFDRAINQATQVLEDRIRSKAGLSERLQGTGLVERVLNPDLSKAVLRVSKDSDEQRGFFDMCHGIMLAFRNPTHHYLTDQITKEEAFKVCLFIDILLPVIENASVQKARTKNVKPPKRPVEGKRINSGIKVGLLPGSQVSWANYSQRHGTWSSFRIYLEVDNYNGKKPDYVAVSLTTKTQEGEWVGNHFIFQGVEKQDEKYRVEAEEVKEVAVFISDHLVAHSNVKPMPEIGKNGLNLLIKTKSGEELEVLIPKDKIIKG